MAKARGRAPSPRTTSFFYGEQSVAADEARFKSNFSVIMQAFKNAKPLKANEAANAAKYLLRIFNFADDVLREVYVTGEGYDFLLEVCIGGAILEISRERADVKAAA